MQSYTAATAPRVTRQKMDTVVEVDDFAVMISVLLGLV